MKPIVSLVLGGSAAALLLLAQNAPLATIPAVGTMGMAESPFAGHDRLSQAAALLILALLASFRRVRTWPVVSAALAVGMLSELSFSAILWRAEKLDLLADIGQVDAAKLIEWRSGVYLFAGGMALAVVYFIWEMVLETRACYPPSSRSDNAA